MNDMKLFIDGSVNTRLKTGYGAYLAVSENEYFPESHKVYVKIKRFENTNSSKLEIQTLLWALDEIDFSGKEVTIYTDSQNIISLLKRHDHLKKNDYYSNKNVRLNNYKLYMEFYEKTENLNCKFIKVQGHKSSDSKDYIDRLFAVVDRAARNALRNNM
ncbi:MAG: ribonuclease H [Spirochaetes bacterium]|nr:ribonuclease H [Spirochaetota bacterium]